MSRKDYEAIANAIAKCKQAPSTDAEGHENAVMHRLAHSIARNLKEDNSNFDTSRFMQACGWNA